MKRSAIAQFIEQAKVIIWDDVSMVRPVIERLDDTLQDILQNNQPFGGKKLILNGDFRQILPVPPYATREEIVSTFLNTSKLWSIMKIYPLED